MYLPDRVSIIGLGYAGNRLAAAVESTVQQVEPDVSFGYIAIDSIQSDVERAAPAAATKVALTWDPDNWSEAKRDHSYLAGTTSPLPTGGTARQRPVGRYLLTHEDTLARTCETLAGALEWEPVASDEGQEPYTHQVWLLAGLGGGTGSGILPLLTGLVNEIVPPETRLFCLGSLPMSEAFHGVSMYPGDGPSVYLNAYAALRECRALFNTDGTDPYPIEFDLTATDCEQLPETLVVEETPIDAFGLLGASEVDMTEPEYREQINAIAADAVVAAATNWELLRHVTDWPHGAGETTLFSVDGAGIRVPAEALTAYAETTAELAALDADRSEQVAQTESELQERRARRQELLEQRDELERTLTAEGRGRYRTLPLDGDAWPTDEPVSGDSSIDELVDRGLVTTAEVRTQLHEAIERIDEPVEEPMLTRRRNAPQIELAVFTAPENERYVTGESEGDGTGTSNQNTPGQFDRTSVVTTEAPGAMRAIAAFTPISLEAVSEYDTIENHVHEADATVADLFRADADDISIGQYIAYPELVGDTSSAD